MLKIGILFKMSHLACKSSDENIGKIMEIKCGVNVLCRKIQQIHRIQKKKGTTKIRKRLWFLKITLNILCKTGEATQATHISVYVHCNAKQWQKKKKKKSRRVISFFFVFFFGPGGRWALWFFKNDKSKTWQANLRLISKFDTVEDFWAWVLRESKKPDSQKPFILNKPVLL